MEQSPETTASLGKLHIDERNGYIGLGRFENGKGQIEWFKITDIENPGLYCVKPKIGWGNKVHVDCEFICDIPSQGRHIKQIVKSRIYCKHRTYTKNSHYEEWDEPGTISIMRGIMVSTYERILKDTIRPLYGYLRFVKDSIYEQALCAFMLSPEYTKQELENRYQALKNALRYDVQCGVMLQTYYHELMQKIQCK